MKKIYQIASKALLLTLIFYIPSVLFAQNPNREGVEENGEIVYKKGDKLIYQWYININGGITQGYCDIQAGTSHWGQLQKESISPAFGLKIGKYISPVFGIHGSFLYGSLEGYNEDRQLSYETSPILEGYLGGTVNFINLFWGYKPRLVDVYALLGIGLVNYTPEAFYHPAPFDFENKESYYDHLVTTNGQDFADGRAETGNTTSTIMPVGFGVDFRLSDRWDINFETVLRLSDDDKLDGYVGSAPGVTNIWGTTVGDAYWYTSLGLGFSFGKSKGPKMNIETEPNILALHGDSIPVEIKGSFPEAFNKKAVVDFTPILKYGDQTIVLETMYFQGAEVPEEYQMPGAVVVPTTGGSFTYKTKVKYEPGMDICELYVDPMVSVKGKTPSSMTDRKIADGLIMTSKRVENQEQLLLADHGFRRDIVATGLGLIYYIVNKHNLNLNYRLNKDDQAKESLANMNDFIAKGWEFKNIEINAWASPEGEESFNQGLSQRRSETAQKYVENVYKKYLKKASKELGVPVEELEQEVKFNLTANGEDWDGFMQAVQSSEIKDKNIIANVVNSQADPAKREQEIRNMAVIYKEIEDDILPPLRRAEVYVNCYEPSLSDDEIAQLATSNPDSLNISQLLYAATLTEDANAKLNIYKSVMSFFPQDWRGYNNAGFASAELGDYAASANYFEKASNLAADNGLVLNNNGAMAAKEGDFETAKEDYLAAQKQGVDVSYNMGIVKIADGNYNGAINSFGSTKCDYNLALAHTLSGNYNAATSTLNCAEKTADVYYLQAVIGARTSNDAMVFENLPKAIAEDTSYRATAIEDREFMKYFSNPEFLNAIK